MFDLMQQRDDGPLTFAEPNEGASYGQYLATAAQLFSTPQAAVTHIGLQLARDPAVYGNLFRSAERQTMLVDTITSGNIATEQAYDRRIATIKTATGIELQNPLRGGLTAQMIERARAGDLAEPDSGTDPAALFDQQLAQLREKHPDKLDALTFGDIGEEARAIAKGAEHEYEAARKNPKLDPATSLVTQFGGAMWGQRRDPLFVGSLFAGPTSAVGKTAVARVATSAVFQGLYNVGISALEQPAVQAWRAEIGAKSGVMPAIENVGMAFLFGLIPGAAFRGIHEASQAAVRRTLAGVPERGDTEIALKAVSSEEPQAAAVRMGEDMADADKAFLPRKPADVAPELHDDLTAAALKRADDPVNQPSPEAVAYVERTADQREMDLLRRTIQQGEEQLATVQGERPRAVFEQELSGLRQKLADMERRAEPDPEIAARVAEAQPQNLHEAQMAATEAIEERGNRQAIARTTEELERDRLPPPEPPPEGVKPPPASSKDPLDKIPITRDDGTPTLVSAQQAARAGEKETKLAALIRECK
jgi:hypothetical protein